MPAVNRPKRKVPHHGTITSAIQHIEQLTVRIEELEMGTEGLEEDLDEDQKEGGAITGTEETGAQMVKGPPTSMSILLPVKSSLASQPVVV